MLLLRSRRGVAGTVAGVRRAEAGFSLVEVLLASALFATLALGAFEAMRLLADAARRTATQHAAYTAFVRVTAQWRAEARGAVAIWTSAPVAGGGRDDCVQLDFAAVAASGPRFWSYRQFPNHAANDAIPGDALQRVEASGPIAPCDPALAGSVVLGGLRAALALATFPPASLAPHADPFTGAPDGAFVATAVPATAPVALGMLDARGAPLAGGNSVVEARVRTGAASRAIDLVPGVVPSGFTEVLHYTCTERCDVGHDGGAAKTLTTCDVAWQSAWTVPGWFVGGTFTFTYAGTRADGGRDALAKPYAASNYDASRDYAAFPPSGRAPDGSLAGSYAPWDARAESAAAWFSDVAPYLPAAQRDAIAREQARCDAVRTQGESSGFFPNG